MGSQVFSPTEVEYWTFDGAAAMKRKCWGDHRECLAAGHALRDAGGLGTAEGSTGQSGETSHLLWVNGFLCLLTSTWEPVRQIPSGRRGPTMNGQPRIGRASKEEPNDPGRFSPVYGRVSRGAGTSDRNDCRKLEWQAEFGQPVWQM